MKRYKESDKGIFPDINSKGDITPPMLVSLIKDIKEG
jgi:hypothetical protein